MNSYSWEGEDVLVRKIMHDVYGIHKGFYVDVGSHHPFNLSNTALLYEEGWRGINIDAMPESMKLFNKYRPQDINLELAVGRVQENSKQYFYIFDDPALNGFLDNETVSSHIARNIKLLQKVEIPLISINAILLEHAKNKSIDVLNIDIEGLDFEVLNDLDMKVFRPKLIITETLGADFLDDVTKSETFNLLSQNEYGLFSRLHYSTIYACRKQYPKINRK